MEIKIDYLLYICMHIWKEKGEMGEFDESNDEMIMMMMMMMSYLSSENLTEMS